MRRLVLVMFVSLIVASAAQANVIISDSFTLNGTTRTAGASLSGPTEVGGVNWSSNTAWKFDSTGAVTASVTQVESVASPVTSGTTLSLDLNFNGYSGGSYAMIGLNNTTPTQPYNWQLWLFVKGTGDWALRQVSTTKASGSGLSVSGGYHNVKIEYDPTTSQASVWFDTTQLAGGLDVSGMAAISCLGFGSANIANMQADNFVVATVPEPVTLVLLMAGSTVALLRRRYS